ncbi:MAG: AAA family ATPase [Selenomonadaceae bacterium]|nr:AAA family ATPase [Selenomonadaceae bacterium]
MPTKKKTMPIGVDNFKDLIAKNYYFVDKTRFIKELLDGHSAVTLLTRPRRFGKTLTLSMLRYFFTLEKAEENRALFAGLDIEKAGEEYMQAQGSRPVIFLSLKEVQQDSFAAELEKMALFLSKLYQEYPFLPDSPSMNETNRKAFHQIVNHAANQSTMENALADLCHYLYLHYGQKPLLLLDEYDAPIIASWEHGYYQDCILFMKRFLGAALKTNDYLDFAVLTGVSRVSKESIFSDLNNLNVCTVLSEKYCDILGFTEPEAQKLMEDNGVGDNMPELKKWYDGYKFGYSEIYNPWSVIKYVDSGCRFQPYWLNTSGNVILRKLLDIADENRRAELTGLMQDKYVTAFIDEGVIYPDIEQNDNALYMMLLTTGYLKAIETFYDESGEEWPTCHLLIPNKELRIVYRKEIIGYLTPKSGGLAARFMLRAMLAGDAATFQKYLQDILREVVSYHDTAKQPENFYHGFLLGLTVLMLHDYRIESNRESGYGRFDLAFFPINKNSPGVILELKAAKGITTEEELMPLAEKALAQISDKEYITELKQQGVENIWWYGVAFGGKRVALAM